jgi:hypothetical protein
MRIAYSAKANISPRVDDQAATLRVLQSIEALPKGSKRRDYNFIQVGQLNSALEVKDEALRNVLLLRLAEVCMEHGSVEIARAALSYVNDDRVIANSRQVDEMEQRRIVRESMKNYSVTETEIAKTIAESDSKISSLVQRRRQSQTQPS